MRGEHRRRVVFGSTSLGGCVEKRKGEEKSEIEEKWWRIAAVTTSSLGL